jgi:hypothetical protein
MEEMWGSLGKIAGSYNRDESLPSSFENTRHANAVLEEC